METLPALLVLWEGKSSVTEGSPHEPSVMFFSSLNKPLTKQWSLLLLKAPWCSCDSTVMANLRPIRRILTFDFAAFIQLLCHFFNFNLNIPPAGIQILQVKELIYHKITLKNKVKFVIINLSFEAERVTCNLILCKYLFIYNIIFIPCRQVYSDVHDSIEPSGPEPGIFEAKWLVQYHGYWCSGPLHLWRISHVKYTE